MAVVRTTRDFEDLLLPLLPTAFRSAREDWLLKVIAPQFVRCFDVVGDACLFGCDPSQPLAGPLAFLAAALGLSKTIYAFDPFAPAGSAFEELRLWSSVLPVRPIRGEMVDTCKLLIDRVSFVWFDLGSAQTIEAVLGTVWPLLGTNSIIALNGVGQTDRPAVKPLVDLMIGKSKAVAVLHLPENGLVFLRPTAP